MAINFTADPESIKKVTNREGDGVGRDSSPQTLATSPAPSYEVGVADKPGLASDGTLTHSGPNAGVMNGIGSNPNDIQGFVSTTGNKVIVDSTFGADTITMQHHSGASIVIDSDGSIHIYSTGKKGVGVISPKGDLTVYARNNLIVKGESRIILESQGDIDFNVGGTLGLHVKGDMITSVQGSVHTSVDGVIINETAKDMSTMVAGDNRLTTAGKMRIQTSKSLDVDVADDINIRTDARMITQTQGDHTVKIKGDSKFDVKGKHTASIEGDTKLQTKGKLDLLATGDTTLQSKAKLNLTSTGAFKVSATGAISLNTSSTTNILGSGAININGSTTTVQTSGSPSVDTAPNPADISNAEKAQYAPANTIIDSITSARVAPDFPVNAKRLSAEEFSYYKNDNQTPNPKAEAYAAGNKGAGAPVSFESAGTAEPVNMGSHDRPAGVSNSNGKSEQNPLPIPTSVNNSSQKISKHFTVGHIDGIRRSSSSQQRAILMEAMNTAWNILDPLVEKYGNRFQITSWYRPKGSANHITGGAVDLRASNKNDVQLTAEIAAYVRDNLPYKQCFLEKNDSPGIHLHIWASPPGSGASGNVLTCADPHCRSSTPGLQLSYAVAALKRAGGKVSA